MTKDKQYENVTAEPTFLPTQYAHKGYTDTFYAEKDESSAGSFLLGALVGGVIGAAAALFLAPKTGKEMREDFSSQATQLKDKSLELSDVAKDKATEYRTIAKDKANEFASTAKEKTDEVTKTIQEQSDQLTDKLKSIKGDPTIPMDDGTASSEGEEASQFVEIAKEKVEEIEEETTKTAEAFKEAIDEKTEDVTEKLEK